MLGMDLKMLEGCAAVIHPCFEMTAEQLLVLGDAEVGMVQPGASHLGITHCLLAAALSVDRSAASVTICSSGCYSQQPWPFGNVQSECERRV